MTRAVIATDRAAITAWATRTGWAVQLDTGALTLTASAQHPHADAVVNFNAGLTGYPALPPAWDCRDDAGAVTRAAFPAAGSCAGITGSIFHTQPVICAPWNLLSYADNGGPHSDWTGPANWKTAAADYTRAHTLADMLSQLHIHLAASPGMQA